MLVGLISDTHGMMRPEALRALEGVELILHAGDVGRSRVLDTLRGIAPVHAVYGNVDATDGDLRAAVDLVLDGVRVHVSHGHELGSPTPAALAQRYDAEVIVYGHTHRPLITRIGPTLIVNPGAAGAARFDLKPSIGLLTLPSRDARIVLL
jgi:putative phosphoesterase